MFELWSSESSGRGTSAFDGQTLTAMTEENALS
jgi:hypothetical protein